VTSPAVGRGGRPSALLPIVLALPALLSFALFRSLRALLQAAKRRYSARHPESSRQWQVISGGFVAKPLVVPLIMTSAPRWNPHAVIGTLGPIPVHETIAFAAAAPRAAGDWFFAVYSHPGHEPAGSASHRHDAGQDWIEVKVPKPGQYVVGARYYRARAEVAFPAARADGAPIAGPSAPIADANQFYATLWMRDSLLYRAIAFYVWALLRCRGRVPERWITRELIPVGNPETRFAFGTCRTGDLLSWKLTPGEREQFDLFLTIYSRGSFPRSWSEGDGPVPAPCDGFYLARIQPKAAGPAAGLSRGETPAIEIASPAL
jgi:hypothetical protein